MGRIRLVDLAKMMGITSDNLAWKLRSIGVSVEGDDPSIDASIIQAILQGKKLPHPREVPLGRSANWAPKRSKTVPIEPGSHERLLAKPIKGRAPRGQASAEQKIIRGSDGFFDFSLEELVDSFAEFDSTVINALESALDGGLNSEQVLSSDKQPSKFVTLGDLVTFEGALGQEYHQIIRPYEPSSQLITTIAEVNAQLFQCLRRDPHAIYSLSSRQFEELVAEILASYGWSVQLTPATKDGGYDIFAISRDRSGLESPWLVECKKYGPDRPVGVEIVRSFWAVKTSSRVANGLIVTSSSFTRGAREFTAQGYDLALRDFEVVIDWINSYRPHPGGRLYLKDKQLMIG